MVEAAIELGFIEYVGFGLSEPDFLQSYIYYNISLINKFNYRGLTARDVEKHLETMRPLLEEREIKFANKIARICYPRLIPACTIPKSEKQRDQHIDRVNSSTD